MIVRVSSAALHDLFLPFLPALCIVVVDHEQILIALLILKKQVPGLVIVGVVHQERINSVYLNKVLPIESLPYIRLPCKTLPDRLIFVCFLPVGVILHLIPPDLRIVLIRAKEGIHVRGLPVRKPQEFIRVNKKSPADIFLMV